MIEYQELRGGAWDVSLEHATMAEAYETPASLASDIGFRTFRLGRRILRKVLA